MTAENNDLETFDVPITMRFTVKAKSFEEAEMVAKRHVVQRLTEINQVSHTTLEARNASEISQQQYNDRVRKVPCSMCNARENEYCKSLRWPDKGTVIQTTHRPRQELYKRMKSKHGLSRSKYDSILFDEITSKEI